MKYAKWLICFGLGLGAVAPAMNAADFHHDDFRRDRREVRYEHRVRYERPRYQQPICR